MKLKYKKEIIMATRKECVCIINAAGIIKDARTLEARSKTINRLIGRYGLSQEAEESSMMEIRDNAHILHVGINSFERACDISKLGDRLDQYKLGKDKLEQFRKDPKNLTLATDAGLKIYTAVISKIEKGLIECRQIKKLVRLCKDEVENMEFDNTLQLWVLETPAAIIAKFPDILEDQDWESLREEFYNLKRCPPRLRGG